MVTISTYRQALDCLNSLPSEATLTHKRFKLDSILVALKAIGNPESLYPIIHVAGTSGKGSVVALVSNGLTKVGYKTGSYFSPHLETPRERIQINGRMISKRAFTLLLNKNWRVIQKCKLSYFEVLTLLAFDYFADQKVDFAVVEVGLGGRLDATNVITPIVSVITSIDFDHEWLLGHTLPKIAREKAGIIKKNVPVVTGASQSNVLKVMTVIAKQKHAQLTVAKLSGTFEKRNQQLAQAVLDKVGMKAKVTKVLAPGRFEQIGDIIIDCAHNPAKMRALVNMFQSRFSSEKAIVVFAAKYDKQAAAMKKILKPITREIITTQVPGSIHEFHSGLFDNPVAAYKHAIKHKKPKEKIIITGSIYLVGELRHVVLQRPKIS